MITCDTHEGFQSIQHIYCGRGPVCRVETRSKGPCPLHSWDLKCSRKNVHLYIDNCDWCRKAEQRRGWVKVAQSGTLGLGAEQSSVHKGAVVRSYHFWRPRDGKSVAEFENWKGGSCGWGARWGGQWARALSRKVVEPVDAVGLWTAVRAIAEFDVSGLSSVVIFTFLKEPSAV